jgi:hypothetical protein
MNLDSAGIAAAIARYGFWFLLAYGWAWGELGRKRVFALVVLWLAGFLLRHLLPIGEGLFTAFVALLDVTVVLLTFKGDVRIG